MLMAVTLITLLTRIPYGITIFRTCVPNTQFLLNGRLCYCNSLGQSSDASCQSIGRRQSCQPGQIIWEDCSQCICQENGKLLCTNTECPDETIKARTSTRSGSAIWCTPFRSYYVNCSLCVCPATGKMSEARCATDSSCALKGMNNLDKMPQNICIPKVMYLFTCLHCLCSDDGLFLKSKCIETCQKPPESARKCIPKSFYKLDCNVCRCPDSGILDSSLCSKTKCGNTKPTSLTSLRNKSVSCTPNKYTSPRCIYCECNDLGTVDEQLCMEQECLKVEDFDYDSVKSTCSKGELVPTCMQCFCPKTKLTTEKFCTRVCSPQNKLAILENVLKGKVDHVDRQSLKELASTDSCEPNSLFLVQGRYCLCSETGKSKQCSSVLEETIPKKSKVIAEKNLRGPIKIDFNMTCEPNTYIEFGCNSCYCTKQGKIDPKWCTSDDCDSKRVINDKARSAIGKSKIRKGPETCAPGSVSKVACNFCICGKSGLLNEKVCTKNNCAGVQKVTAEKLNCEPSAYYTVDCNMCYCPSDGIKNVDKCTKNQCESSFLRSDVCTPGELFSEECSICVCPPNGDKKDKVCTNRTCSENDTPWKKIFKISETMLDSHDGVKNNLGSCVPGEEFEIGTKQCLHLKEYGLCTGHLCDDDSNTALRDNDDDLYHEMDHFKEDRDMVLDDNDQDKLDSDGRRMFNDILSRSDCTPGSEYIIECKICVCPYKGEKDSFCHPMPPSQYCEQKFPGVNFLSPFTDSLRKTEQDTNSTEILPMLLLPHNHTEYSCDVTGQMKDDCFYCSCTNKVLIKEHCYRSADEKCTNTTVISFLKDENRLN